MKKINVLEFIFAFCFLILTASIVWQSAYGYSQTQSLITSPDNTTVSPTYSLQVLSPNPGLQVSGIIRIEVRQFPTTGAEYRILLPYDSTTTAYKTVIGPVGGQIVDSATGLVKFPDFDTKRLPNGLYILDILSFNCPLTTTSNCHVQQPMPIFNPTQTITPLPTETDSNTSTDITTPTTISEEFDKVQETLSDPNVPEGTTDDVQTALLLDKIKRLPQELQKAPISLLISTKSAVISLNEAKDKGRVKLSGKGEPNTTLYLYIYSDPIIVTVQTDDYGNWEYELEEELAVGDHEVYVAVKDEQSGEVEAKSLPYNFFVGEALAAAVGQEDAVSAGPQNYLMYYVAFAVSLVTLVVAGLLYLTAKKHVRKHEAQAQN